MSRGTNREDTLAVEQQLIISTFRAFVAAASFGQSTKSAPKAIDKLLKELKAQYVPCM